MDMNVPHRIATGALPAQPHSGVAAKRRRWLAVVLVAAGFLLAVALYLVLVQPWGQQAERRALGWAPASADHRELLAERERLVRENAALSARLRTLETQGALAEKLDAQAARLAQLAERLEGRLTDAEAGAAIAPEDASPALLASVQQELTAAQSQVGQLQARVAELEARLQQQQLTVEEAVLRADKAEKLHAALEESHARVRTENERLSMELATAKERQAQAMQRVLELDTQLTATAARAGASATPASVTPVDDVPAGSRAQAGAVTAGDAPATAPASSGISTVVYEVREEDTLSRIAAKVYGDASAWQRIFDANRDVLDGPDDLTLGMRLIIP